MTLKHVVNIYEPPYVLRLHLLLLFFFSYAIQGVIYFMVFLLLTIARYLTAICLQLVLSFCSCGIAFCGNRLIYLIAFSAVLVFSVNAFLLYTLFLRICFTIIYNCFYLYAFSYMVVATGL